ncbi:J domain-containing protein [Hansschlegelia plantiphila]|uniref:J domain-containing protein n=1 Tax=Hansschlegelia plantiphila TaxID=374655 RepID=A0A9W6IYY0_9HYPH|nr:J domain-containing protein [Hansschlegelia plantiphila]GLK66648.1 hypothetical protein GCM10008179_02860 [Hansschlegelia plantiphila]
MAATAYPISWPMGFARTKHPEKGRFSTTLPAAIKNVQDSIRLFGQDSGKAIQGLVISSNYTLGGLNPPDPAVAVYFTWDGLQVCIPVDRYTTLAGNLQAIHHIVEARRVELRHGTLNLVRASFQGFAALPAPGSARPWHEVLGVSPAASRADINSAFRSKAAAAHPDAGGSHDAMAALTAARDAGLKAVVS